MLASIRTGAVAAPLVLILGLAHAQQPNILLIVADDVGYSDRGDVRPHAGHALVGAASA